MSPALAWMLCVAATLSYGMGAVLQSLGARRAAAAGVGLAGLVRQPVYLAGVGLDVVGWVASLGALRGLPLFAVQAVLAGSVAVTVALARVLLGTRLRRVDLWAIALSVAALAVVGVSAAAEGAPEVSASMATLMLAGVVALAGATTLGARRLAPVVLGAVSGVAFAASAVSARAFHCRADLSGIVRDPLSYAVLGYGVVGMLGYAVALERGEVGPVTSAMWVSEVVVTSVVGVTLLGDSVRPGWLAPAVVAVLAAVGATVVLAMSPGHATAGS